MPDGSARFVRVAIENDDLLADFSRESLHPTPNVGKPTSSADFMSRLWARLGRPDPGGGEGFAYTLEDRKTGLRFRAMSWSSGPKYLGQDDPRMRDVIVEFDSWIASATPADCEYEIHTDLGRYRLGARGGVPLEEPAVDLRRDAKPETARSPTDCERIAAARTRIEGARHGLDFPPAEGWASCLRELFGMPGMNVGHRPRGRATIAGIHARSPGTVEVINWSGGPNREVVALCVLDGGPPTPVFVEQIVWGPLTEPQKLWLDAHAAWHQKAGK